MHDRRILFFAIALFVYFGSLVLTTVMQALKRMTNLGETISGFLLMQVFINLSIFTLQFLIVILCYSVSRAKIENLKIGFKEDGTTFVEVVSSLYKSEQRLS